MSRIILTVILLHTFLCHKRSDEELPRSRTLGKFVPFLIASSSGGDFLPPDLILPHQAKAASQLWYEEARPGMAALSNKSALFVVFFLILPSSLIRGCNLWDVSDLLHLTGHCSSDVR
jgi:hypothetical protein